MNFTIYLVRKAKQQNGLSTLKYVEEKRSTCLNCLDIFYLITRMIMSIVLATVYFVSGENFQKLCLKR